MLTFFIAGLLYLLGFERVDNLGAHSILLETGLLIPSGSPILQILLSFSGGRIASPGCDLSCCRARNIPSKLAL